MPGVAAQRAHQLGAGGLALQEAAGDAEQVVVVLCDQPRVDPVGRDPIELAVVGSGVDPPEPSAAGIGESW